MSVINWPDAPAPGERFTTGDNTYEWRTEGYWYSLESSVNDLNPTDFCFILDTIPANALELLYRVDLGTDQTLDLDSDFIFSLISTAPATDQTYDVWVNEVLATDTIIVRATGLVEVDVSRGPFTGPVTLKVRVSTGTTIDGTFPGFAIVARINTP
jgi:hypothetical protein